MPKDAMARVRGIQASMEAVESESAQYLAYRRQLFTTCEKYLDSGYGFSPFESTEAAGLFMTMLEQWANEAGWVQPVCCVMPSHVHLLGGTLSDTALELKDFVKRLKGRSSRKLNLLLGRKGTFCQPDRFDRWKRTEAVFERVARYILENPVKAGLVLRSEDYEFSKGGAVAG